MKPEENLMAFVDGELGAEEASFRAALAQDERLQEDVAREKELRRKLAALHGHVLNEDVPDRLTRLLVSQRAEPAPFRPLPFVKASGTSRPIGWWRNVTAIAASLVLGLFLGQAITDPSGKGSASVTATPNEQLALALETQLASAQRPGDPVVIGATFIGQEGQPCRTYEYAGSAGLACRSGGEWQLKLVAPGLGSQIPEYQQAGSASELVMQSAQNMLAEGPLNASAEREARDAGWARGTP